jgi:hypothetical protein
MRKAMFILAATAALPILGSAGVQPARAVTSYPYCTAATRWDAPHCDYRTLAECVSANAGLAYTCVPNKWYTGASTPRRAG